MTADLEDRLRTQAQKIAYEGYHRWSELCVEVADVLGSQADRIEALESSQGHLRDALRVQSDKIQSMALQSISDEANRERLQARIDEQAERIQALEAKCALLAASLGQSESLCADLEQDARRYRWLRRRCFMIDASSDVSFILHFFNDEGPTGEFLDDVVDSAIAPQAGSKEEKQK